VKTHRWLLASAIALTAAPVAAASTGAFSTERLSQVDKMLASDAFQGRGTASTIEPTVITISPSSFRPPASSRAATWSMASAAGSNPCRCLNRRSSARPQISLDENGTVVPLAQGPEIAVIAPLNGAKRVDIDNAPLIFLGYGVSAPSAIGTISKVRMSAARSSSS
jgi:hypothetical protein